MLCFGFRDLGAGQFRVKSCSQNRGPFWDPRGKWGLQKDPGKCRLGRTLSIRGIEESGERERESARERERERARERARERESERTDRQGERQRGRGREGFLDLRYKD